MRHGDSGHGDSSLDHPQVRNVLKRMHGASRRDWLKFIALYPKAAIGILRGRSLMKAVTPEMMKHFYIPVSRETGMFLYLTARAINAGTVVEFGTSFGISTIYLAAAIRDNGGGTIIGTEIESSKHRQAETNLREAGLGGFTDIRLGDALETLKEIPGPVDMVFMDGWKNLYLPVIRMLKPKLRRGALILADNILQFKRTLRPYRDFVRSPDNGFSSVSLPIGDGVEYSCYLG